MISVMTRVDDLGDDSAGRDPKGVVGPVTRHVDVAHTVHGDACRIIKDIARAVAGHVDVYLPSWCFG